MPAEPKTAAACVIVRGDAEPEVLLAKRSPALRFMAGHHVFPGGRVHESESVHAVVHAPDWVTPARSPAAVVHAPGWDHARAIHAVAREVFEETGLLCVRGTLPSREVTQDARRQIIQEELNFADFLVKHWLSID